MDSKLERVFTDLERRREMMVKKVGGLHPGRQNAHTKGAWSPVQIVDHLATAEEVYLIMMEQGEPNELRQHTAKRRIPYRLLVWSMRRAMSVPTMAAMQPRDNISLEDAADHWTTIRRRVRNIVDQTHPENVVLLHPYFGPLSAEQVLEVFDAHMTYHEKRFPSIG